MVGGGGILDTVTQWAPGTEMNMTSIQNQGKIGVGSGVKNIDKKVVRRGKKNIVRGRGIHHTVTQLAPGTEMNRTSNQVMGQLVRKGKVQKTDKSDCRGEGGGGGGDDTVGGGGGQDK